MSPDRLAMYAPLVVLLAWSAASDLRWRRIPNWISFTLILSGLFVPWRSFAGLGVGFALPFVLYLFGALGAGDVKLLAGVGIWVGPTPLLLIFAAAAIIGLVIVLVQCTIQKRIGLLLRNTATLTMSVCTARSRGQLVEAGRGFVSIDAPLPYAALVLVGTLAVLLGGGMNGK
jgi:prepilin peptidase CpaA